MQYYKTAGNMDITEWDYVEVPNHCGCRIIKPNPFDLI